MAIEISTWLKPDIKAESLEQENDIFLYMNNDFVSGDNQKYMKMYDWMSYVYDFGEDGLNLAEVSTTCAQN